MELCGSMLCNLSTHHSTLIDHKLCAVQVCPEWGLELCTPQCVHCLTTEYSDMPMHLLQLKLAVQRRLLHLLLYSSCPTARTMGHFCSMDVSAAGAPLLMLINSLKYHLAPQ